MEQKKHIFAIIGSASKYSANQKLVEALAALMENDFHVTIYSGLKSLPHFDPELSLHDPPKEIIAFREAVAQADGLLICTPEYVFSIPSGLKNALEWCVATMVFSEKPIGLITASADGQKGHEELQLIMQTVMTQFTPETTLLIRGVKGKINDKGQITDDNTKEELLKFAQAYKALVKASSRSQE